MSPSTELPDLVYIDRDIQSDNIHGLMASLPFRGRGWYARPAVEFLLHTNRVCWEELKYGIAATGHMPGNKLREAFDVMEKAWDDVMQEFRAQGVAPSRTKPAKDSVNCWVGFCGMPPTNVHMRTTLSFDPH